MARLPRLTSAPVLAGALVVFTLLAAGPLQPYDEMFQGYWAKHYTPNWATFLDKVPNAVAGQAVCLPVLAAVAIRLAWRHRTWHPLAVVAAAEAGFYVGIGGMKVLLGRTAPAAGEGGFWQGGPLAHGWYGIAYPSGHAAEAVLIYGAAAYLVLTYAGPDHRLRRRLTWLVGLIALNAIIVAFYLGFHWPTDLVAGLLAGGLVLRLLVDGDRALARRGLPFGWSHEIRRPEPEPAQRPQPVPVPAAVWLRAPLPRPVHSIRPLTAAWSVPIPGAQHTRPRPDRELQLH
ncbi:phosphatase PAP2 family protein [Janibacter sp. LM]|uniref:phosphatase PAP2 family protein n=1 Tax=Janibacter TaxID=53457 RepID=UPI0031F64052